MRFLVDANVLSEPARVAPNPSVVAWLEAYEGDFVVDAIVLGELRAGVLALPSGRKRTRLERWFDSLVRTIECLPWDLDVSLRRAILVARLRRKGASLPLLDSMIAASALRHGLTVVTRNTSDFRRAGVKVLNPFV